MPREIISGKNENLPLHSRHGPQCVLLSNMATSVLISAVSYKEAVPGNRGGYDPYRDDKGRWARKPDPSIVVAFVEYDPSAPSGSGVENFARDPDEALQRYGLERNGLARALSVAGVEADISVLIVNGQGWENVETRNRLEIRSRMFRRDADGRRVEIGYQHFDVYTNREAEFQALVVDDTGRGLGTQLFRQKAEYLASCGITKAYLFANITIGRYAWAVEGVEYKNGTTSDYATRINRWLNLRGVPRMPEWPDDKPQPAASASRAEWEEWAISYHDAPIAYWKSQFSSTSPKEFTTWKHPTGFKLHGRDIDNPDVPPDMELDIGKAFLLDKEGHGSWDGKIHLTKGE